MKVVILAGGLGTRLREETEIRPKPMVEIGGRPILWHIMRGHAARGFTEFVLALRYKQEVVKRCCLDYYNLQADLTAALGTGGIAAHDGARLDRAPRGHRPRHEGDPQGRSRLGGGVRLQRPRVARGCPGPAPWPRRRCDHGAGAARRTRARVPRGREGDRVHSRHRPRLRRDRERLRVGGAQERFGVLPDLATLGKGMANGLPLAAVVGRVDLMRKFEEVFVSSTFGGEALSLAAAKATIAKLRERNVVEQLWRQGAALRDGYNALAREAGLAERTRCIGFPPRTVLTFWDAAGADSLAMKSLFQQEMIKRGILIGGGFNICYAHSDDDIRRALEACRDALAILARALAEDRVEQRLEGPVIQPVFRSA